MRSLIGSHLIGLSLLCAAWTGRAGDFAAGPDAAARKLYLGKCAKCHKLYDPAKYSDAQWTTWMNKMTRKAKLQPEQKEMLSRYIEESLRSPKRPLEQKSSTAGEGSPKTQ